eukprot:797925-Prymnesium_polylepis.2
MSTDRTVAARGRTIAPPRRSRGQSARRSSPGAPREAHRRRATCHICKANMDAHIWPRFSCCRGSFSC